MHCTLDYARNDCSGERAHMSGAPSALGEPGWVPGSREQRRTLHTPLSSAWMSNKALGLTYAGIAQTRSCPGLLDIQVLSHPQLWLP